MKNSLADFTSALPAKIPTEPEEPKLWHQLDPEDALDPWGEFEEPEPPGIPFSLGPARSGPAGPASGVDLQSGRMAAELHWEIQKATK
jgi:hypothetical protein